MAFPRKLTEKKSRDERGGKFVEGRKRGKYERLVLKESKI